MSEFSCAQMADVVDELALDVLPGDLRALAFDHLEGCPTCRSRVEELSESADQLLLAYRPIDPPPGFEERVLERLAQSVYNVPDVLETARRPRRFRRLALGLAAAAAVAAALAAGAGALLGGGGHGRAPGAPVAAPPSHALRTVALLSSGGQPIGDVSVYPGTPAWFFMRVDNGVGNDVYLCVLDLDGGGTVPMGRIVLADGQGGWGQHVNVDARLVRSARLVEANGTTVATATFH